MHFDNWSIDIVVTQCLIPKVKFIIVLNYDASITCALKLAFIQRLSML